MTDTFPPANLGADSAPWGRKVEEDIIIVRSIAEAIELGIVTINSVQKTQGEQIASNNGDRVRDINAVNSELTRLYNELVGVNNTQNGRMTTINGDLQGYKFDNNTRLNGVDFSLAQLSSRISTVESRTTLVQASSIDGLEFLARGGSGQWYRVPQSVGSPLGGDIKWPFSLVYASDRWGPRVSPGGIGSTFHRAVDFYHPSLDIRAAGRGVVIAAGDAGGFGNRIDIRHSPTLVTGYSHLSSIGVSVGQAVSQGQSIGIMGTTGTSTGVHLHFDCILNGELVNPETLITGDDYL